MKKIILIAGAAGVLALTSTAFAEEDASVRANMGMRMSVSQPMMKMDMLNISPSGEATIRGTVSAVNGNIVSVKSWGGEWMIRISDATQYNAPKRWMMATSSTSSSTVPTPVKFTVGDFIGVQGRVSTDASWTIDAKFINNRKPVPMPIPLPFPVGSSTVYCIKAPCPVIDREGRDQMKQLQEYMREQMKGQKQGGQGFDKRNESHAGNGGDDKRALDSVRSMLNQQLKMTTDTQVQAQLQQALLRLNTTFGASASGSVSN